MIDLQDGRSQTKCKLRLHTAWNSSLFGQSSNYLNAKGCHIVIELVIRLVRRIPIDQKTVTEKVIIWILPWTVGSVTRGINTVLLSLRCLFLYYRWPGRWIIDFELIGEAWTGRWAPLVGPAVGNAVRRISDGDLGWQLSILGRFGMPASTDLGIALLLAETEHNMYRSRVEVVLMRECRWGNGKLCEWVILYIPIHFPS